MLFNPLFGRINDPIFPDAMRCIVRFFDATICSGCFFIPKFREINSVNIKCKYNYAY